MYLFFLWSLCAEANQELIMAQGGISLLAMTAGNAEDPQTLRMVAGAIANLCGNGTSFALSLSLSVSEMVLLCLDDPFGSTQISYR